MKHLILILPLLGAAAVSFALELQPPHPARNWKCVYGTNQGPEGKALTILNEKVSELALRDDGLMTYHVFPLERAGQKPLHQKNRFIVGCPQTNPVLADYVKPADVPDGGYLVKTVVEGDTNTVLIAGSTPTAVLWATFDFCNDYLYELTWRGKTGKEHAGWFVSPRMFFTVPRLPPFERKVAPATPVRSLFTWGHVVSDYRAYFRAMAELKLNRIILWNEFPPINAADVVREAHDWGIAVYWGFAWGWTADLCLSAETTALGKLADSIVAEWRSVWKALPGDGLYFQTFTEQYREKIDGRPIASLAVEVVNNASRRIKQESPTTDIVFGLHATSVRNDLAEIEKTDRSMEILWENCGGFPYLEQPSNPDYAFHEAILASQRPVGLVWKCQMRQDWEHWSHQEGPFMLGENGEKTRARDAAYARREAYTFDEDWLERGAIAHALLKHVRALPRPPYEMNLVGEYNPPFSLATRLQAEMFWSADDWPTIRSRVERKARNQN